MAKEATVGLAEWRVGARPGARPRRGSEGAQTFALDGDALEWTVALRTTGRGRSRSATSRCRSTSRSAPAPAATSTREAPPPLVRRRPRLWSTGSAATAPARTRHDAGRADQVRVSTTARRGARLRRVHAVRPRPGREPRRRPPPAATGACRYRPHARAEGLAGRDATYTFRFQWAKDFAGVRDVLYEEGKFDTAVVPGHGGAVRSSGDVLAAHENAIAAIEPSIRPRRASRPPDGRGRHEGRIASASRGSARTCCGSNTATASGARSSSSSPSRSRPSSRSARRSSSAITSTPIRRSGTSACTATGIRRTRSCAARRIATACRPG